MKTVILHFPVAKASRVPVSPLGFVKQVRDLSPCPKFQMTIKGPTEYRLLPPLETQPLSWGLAVFTCLRPRSFSSLDGC